jgi:hypothetical protein
MIPANKSKPAKRLPVRLVAATSSLPEQSTDIG